MATVDFCGVRRQICVDTVENAAVGDYVVAHAGVAISVMNREEAEATLRDLETITAEREKSSGL
ncbi:MAG: HypC/HybG/HupF family hydrogenase formation chaperone [Clostridium sp.]|nr:HypC/HybG/HupF family hydrogenase formation chaperone [Clostridium sp.]